MQRDANTTTPEPRDPAYWDGAMRAVAERRRSLPMHSHGGSELTQILQGAYDDTLGHFAPGDMADLDGNTRHQPVTCPGVACICVTVLDAPLEFSGWFARKLQPLVGL